MPSEETFELSAAPVPLNTLAKVARTHMRLRLTSESALLIERGAAYLAERAASGDRIYGVNTGFGSLENHVVDVVELQRLQYNLLLSHASAIGPPASEPICRLTHLLKLMTVCRGITGISLPIVDRLVTMWNASVIPAFPTIGTVGASGDLAPLAHFALPLLGLGQVYDEGELRPASAALRQRSWPAIELTLKSGLALANGIQYIAAHGVSTVVRMRQVLQLAEIISSISTQSFACSQTFYDTRLAMTSGHPERTVSLENLSRLLAGSNHHELPTCRISKQDPYSFRCIPQVHGAVRQVIEFAARLLEQECNTVSDNPLVLSQEETILYCGNMHGASVGMAMDCAAIAITDLSSLSQCRTFQLLLGRQGLPDYLSPTPGLHSGYMMPQVIAAALYAENVGHATPASPITVMTCQFQEDHVSMAGGAGRKMDSILDNTLSILAIELLLATQAAELQNGLLVSPLTRTIINDVRTVVPHLTIDRPPGPDIEILRSILAIRGSEWIERCGLL